MIYWCVNTDQVFSERRKQIIKGLIMRYSSKEIVVDRVGLFGKIKPGFGSVI